LPSSSLMMSSSMAVRADICSGDMVFASAVYRSSCGMISSRPASVASWSGVGLDLREGDGSSS
jgi:hypothetical protein